MAEKIFSQQTLLTKLYDGIFHRPLDAGASGYAGNDINFVLDQLRASGEHKAYTALFSAVKALENAERESAELSEEDKQEHKDIIDSALSTVNQWAKQLSEQARADAVVGPEQARAAVQAAYDSLNPKHLSQKRYCSLEECQQDASGTQSLLLPSERP